MSKFKPAERSQVKLKLALTGPSGSGKTMSALLMAAGIGKKIAVVDTENGSASLYANVDKGPLSGIAFDALEIAPPYTISKYVEAIDAAQKEGYDVLIIDSISHAWAGEGGLLDKKSAMDQRGSNQYTNWAGITKEQEIFKAKILNADIHIICTMRSKQDYVLENKDGKSTPKKVGLAPIQRDGTEYEFTTVLDLAMDHNAAVSKDRTGLWDGLIFKPSVDTGKALLEWLSGGKPVTKPVAPVTNAVAQPKAAPKPMTEAQAVEIMGLVEKFQGLTKETDERISAAINDRIEKVHKVRIGGISDLNEEMATTLIKSLIHWCHEREKKLAENQVPPEAGKEQG
jgi:hypothetical protein